MRELGGMIFVVEFWLFCCSSWVNLPPRQETWQGHRKASFSRNLNHSRIPQKVFAPWHIFIELQLSATQKMGECNPFFWWANKLICLLPPIVDWLCEGREAGDKRKAQRERGLFDFPYFTLPCSPSLGRLTRWWRIILTSLTLRLPACDPSPPLSGVDIDPLLLELPVFVTMQSVWFVKRNTTVRLRVVEALCS